MITRISGFLDEADCGDIIRAFPSARGKGGVLVREYSHRTEVITRVFEGEIRRILADARDRATNLVRTLSRDNMQTIDLSVVTEMRVGDTHALHADNVKPDGKGGWVPNHTPWRDWSAILYLNTQDVNYTGGLFRFTKFPPHRPMAGDLLVFPATGEYEHWVEQIASGSRFSISMWTSADPSRFETF